jgi:HK97 family phage portal protein
MQIKPTIWQRVNMAARLMRGEPFRNLPSQAKQAPGSIFIWPDFRQGSPVWASGNFEDYALEGFQRNSLIYSAIMFKVRAQMAAPLRAYEGDVDSPTPLKASHPLAQLLARPNLYMSWPEFQGINTVYLNLAGETFIALLRPRMGGMVERMLPLRPDRCFPIPDSKGGLKGYFYCPENVNPANGIPIAVEDMIHVKLPNPLDPLEGLGRGLSPLASLAYSASVDNMITEFLYGFFKTGAMPTGILRFNVPLQAEEADRIKERWHELHGGYEKWSDVAVLDNAGEYQRVGLTFEEMGFLGIDERNESRILGPFGVPPILIGSRMGMLHSTYSNYEQARKAFWEDTFKPELSMYELEYKYYLQGDGGEFVAFDYSDVPALQKDVIPAVAAWAQMVDRGVPKNVAAGVLKIPLPALPDDDVGYMNPMLQSVGGKAPLPNTSTTPALPAPKPETEETEEGAAEAEEQSDDEEGKAMKRPFEMKALLPEAKADHWKRFDATARRHEEAMRRVAVKRFREDEKEYLAAITGTRRKSIEDKATIDWEYLTSQWDKATFESEKLWEADLIPVLKGVITDAGEQLGQTVGLSFTLPDIRGAAWFNRYVLKFAKNDATQITNATKDQLSALLQQAKIEGWSMRELEKQLGATFDRFLGEEANLSEEERAWFAERNVPYRIENIARTETIRASNGGNFDLMRAWGAPQHEWLATMDDRAREDHLDANGHIVDVGDYFYVGGEKMLYPGDPNASAGNVVNCRCTTVPVGIEDMDKPKPFDPDSESIGQ